VLKEAASSGASFSTAQDREAAMRSNIVFTLTGADRIGIVEDVTQLLLAHGGNVETSRMARLGGAFAMLMLVSIPAAQRASLETDLETLAAQGYKVTTEYTEQTYAETQAGWQPFQIAVQGADHEGIVHEIAAYLAGRGINIESMDTETTPAPISGSPLFAMTALIVVPPDLLDQGWEAALKDVGQQLNVAINVSVAQNHPLASLQPPAPG
jgi:glycine cleavage system transcriptional repressor